MKIIYLFLLLLVGCTGVIIDESTPYELTKDEVYTLEKALDNEYLALTFYQQAADDFGEVFLDAVRIQDNNIIKLNEVFEDYEIDVPENENVAQEVDNIKVACENAILFERRKAYNNLISQIDNPDVVEVFRELSKISENQLAIFKGCSLI